jgi:hypothetical protein
MDWDIVLLTGTLSGVLMLVVLLGLIWQDRTPREPEDEPGGPQENQYERGSELVAANREA